MADTSAPSAPTDYYELFKRALTAVLARWHPLRACVSAGYAGDARPRPPSEPRSLRSRWAGRSCAPRNYRELFGNLVDELLDNFEERWEKAEQVDVPEIAEFLQEVRTAQAPRCPPPRATRSRAGHVDGRAVRAGGVHAGGGTRGLRRGGACPGAAVLHLRRARRPHGSAHPRAGSHRVPRVLGERSRSRAGAARLLELARVTRALFGGGHAQGLTEDAPPPLEQHSDGDDEDTGDDEGGPSGRNADDGESEPDKDADASAPESDSGPDPDGWSTATSRRRR